jgi:hypothetical protein
MRRNVVGPKALLVVVAVALATACATDPTVRRRDPEPDKLLFERGTEALEKRRWLVARELQELMDTYPQTTTAPTPSSASPIHSWEGTRNRTSWQKTSFGSSSLLPDAQARGLRAA